MELKHFLFRLLPRGFKNILRYLLQRWDNHKNRNRSARVVFTEIYEKRLWGSDPSGPGSHLPSVTEPYISLVQSICRKFNSPTIVDLGCGDMTVSKSIIPLCSHFIGVDVVAPLIEEHRKTYWGPTPTQFDCLDIVEDELPGGDIALLRQVLQHLSNDQIKKILPKLQKYRLCLVTEHHPSMDAKTIPNKDLIHGLWSRVTDTSGVFLDKPPFNVLPATYQLLLESPGISLTGSSQGTIRTYGLTWAQ